MWLFLFFCTIVWLYVKALLHWYSLYLMILGSLVYVLYWIDGAWLSGTRAWEQLRTLKLWRKMAFTNYYFPSSADNSVFGSESPTYKKYIFVVMPNSTNYPLFWGFGMHGGRFAPQIRLRYLLPAILFYVPLLRDLLMWSGAVAHNANGSGDEGLWSTINDLLNRGYSVAYSANGMLDAFSATSSEREHRVVQTPSDALFTYSKQEEVALVPVLVSGETERYVFAPQPSFMVRLQEFCYRNWGYPFPVIFMPTRQSRMHLQFCSVLQPHLYEKPQDMKQAFVRAILSANNTGADRKIQFL